MITFYIFLFFIFGFLGWVQETVMVRLTEGVWEKRGYLWGFPLLPVYGVGGILMYSFIGHMRTYPEWAAVLLTGIAVITLEYMTGLWCDHILHEELWSYHHHVGNIHGKISIMSGVWWTFLTFLFYLWGWELVDRFRLFFEINSNITREQDLKVLIMFVMLFFIVLIIRRTYGKEKGLWFAKKRRRSHNKKR